MASVNNPPPREHSLLRCIVYSSLKEPFSLHFWLGFGVSRITVYSDGVHDLNEDLDT